MEKIQNVILYKQISPQSKNVFELYLLIFLKNIRNLISFFFFFLELYNTNAFAFVQKCYILINRSGFVVRVKIKISLTYCTTIRTHMINVMYKISSQNLYSNKNYRKFQGYPSSSHLEIIHQEQKSITKSIPQSSNQNYVPSHV